SRGGGTLPQPRSPQPTRVHLRNPQRCCGSEPDFTKLMPGHSGGLIFTPIPSHLRGRDERSAGGGRRMGCRPPPPSAVRARRVKVEGVDTPSSDLPPQTV